EGIVPSTQTERRGDAVPSPYPLPLGGEDFFVPLAPPRGEGRVRGGPVRVLLGGGHAPAASWIHAIGTKAQFEPFSFVPLWLSFIKVCSTSAHNCGHGCRSASGSLSNASPRTPAKSTSCCQCRSVFCTAARACSGCFARSCFQAVKSARSKSRA